VDEIELSAIIGRSELIAMQQAVENVHVSTDVGRYIIAVVVATRESPSVQVDASPRGSLALLKLARVQRVQGEDVVHEWLTTVPVPAAEPERRRYDAAER
jgi:MoxR-like ATPase